MSNLMRWNAVVVLLLAGSACDAQVDPADDASSPALPCDPDAWQGDACFENNAGGRIYCVVSDAEEVETPCLTKIQACLPGDPGDANACGYCAWSGESFEWVPTNTEECQDEEDDTEGEPDPEEGGTTPLVLRFDDTPVRFVDDTRPFALGANGTCTHTDWPSEPWLVLDADGDGLIRSGAELFGTATPRKASGIASDGFAALSALDDNLDGKIDAHDNAFAALELWRDHDGDRVGTATERHTLAAAGVVSIDLDYRVAPRCDGRGNCVRERATFTFHGRDGRTRKGDVLDVHLRCR